VPTTAGPYTLTGNAGPGREVVRAAIRVDPVTAQITVASDPLPTILEGIPLQIRAVNVTINRPNFTFNPTNCSRLETTATFTSTQQASATGSSPFYASGCAALPFHPTLTASSQARTSRVNGASLDIRVASKPGEADVAKTDLQLPAQLPSRLSTLHHACLAAQFNANPAGCPAESNIGMATVTTPVLNSPLSGPIYLVSFGNAGFPDTEIVLQGEGVTTILDGKTDIKRGITYSNFESIPDVPFTSFTAHLPAGPHSVFAAFLPSSANESLCGQGLVIPTTIVGQNGRGFRQSTPIQITGCPTGVAVRAKHARRRGHRATLVLSIYTPTAGTLHIAGRGVDPATIRVQADRNATVTLNVTPGHASRTRLTLTLTSRGAPKLVSHITAKL
jgi:hypothetical protein